MRVLLIYDIRSDRIRLKVADLCQDFGLDRIQFSAFAGELSRSHQESLFRRITNLIGDRGGRVWLLPVAADDWARRFELDVPDPGSPAPEAALDTATPVEPRPPLARRPGDPF